MAGDWIKMRTDLVTSPKVVRMASALKADRFRVAGGLLSVWSLFDAHSDDGVLHGYTLETVDELAAWPGFSAAMEAVGWVAVDGESLALPEFDTHNGQSAKRRAQDKDRKKSVRKSSASDEDTKRTREEKRREDLRASSRTPPADAQREGVAESNGPAPPFVENTGNALAVVMACKALRRLGMLDVQPQLPDLHALVARGATTEQMAMTAAELTLRAARKGSAKCLMGLDPEPHPELLELFASGATAEQMYLRPAELAELKTYTPKFPYLAATLIGRANDQLGQEDIHANQGSQRNQRASGSGAGTVRESATARAERKRREGDARDAAGEAANDGGDPA